MDDDTDDDRVVRTVDPGDDGGRVTVPAEWVGARVEVVRTGPGRPDRTDYDLAGADGAAAFATTVDGERYAGPDVAEHLERGAADGEAFYVGLAEDDAGTYHATVDRGDTADGLVVLDDGDPRASALLANVAWQAIAGGAGGAVFARDGPTAERVARALPEDRAEDVQVVGAGGRSVNLIDPAVPPSSAAFFDAVDAVTDALVSLLVVVDPQLRDAVREFVMAAHSTHADTTLVELRELVRHGKVGDDADVPDWVPEKSPDLLDRVDGVDAEAIDWLLDSLAPLLREPARSLLADPDPDVSLVEVVRAGAPLFVRVGDRYGVDTWRTVGRALVHMLWGAAREFVDDADDPLHLVGDEFGPVLDGERDLDKLFARLHRDPVAPVLGVDPAAVGADPWEDLAAAAGIHATFGLVDPRSRERAADLAGLDPDAFVGLPAGGFWLTGGGDPGRHLGYHPVAPERPRAELDWLE